jgi:hypothetical protein
MAKAGKMVRIAKKSSGEQEKLKTKAKAQNQYSP